MNILCQNEMSYINVHDFTFVVKIKVNPLKLLFVVYAKLQNIATLTTNLNKSAIDLL